MGLYFSELGPSFVGIRDIIAIFPIFIFAKILIYELIEDSDYFFELLQLLKILLIISLVFLGVQLMVGMEFSLSKELNPNIILSNGIRYPAFFGDPQDFSMFLAIMSFMCLIKKDNNSKIPILNYILILLSVLGILSSGGRAGLIGFIFGIFLIVIFGKSLSAKIWIIVLGVLTYFVIMEFQNKFAIFNRGTDLDDAYKFRHEIWGQAFDMFLNKPIFGIGIGNYERHVVIYNPDQVWPTGDDFIPFDCPENGYLKFLSELGGPSFIIIFIILLLPVFRGLYMFFLKKDFILIYLFSGFMVWMIGFNSNYSFGDIRIEILIGILISMLISRQHFLTINKTILAD
jgi:O-antigen ligase